MFYPIEVHVKRTHVRTYYTSMLLNIKVALSHSDNVPASVPGQTPSPAEGIWGIHIPSVHGCNSLEL